MATDSFDKRFVVTDQIDIQRFKSKFGHAHKVAVKRLDVKGESKRCVKLLKGSSLASRISSKNSAKRG